ncbi:MAG: ribosome biogenesis GTPase Der [Anaerolineae bacterium]|jgi:GTP-binding protein|nr:ribosome biogenesis GTPase Der [Anaerolineae bacterium]MBT4311363.1 ribosome biogenesis GTPase Der [Anaerolineae bacterium]MBT4459579.1 ribosome biogenesis GTPase Der [Anaerolineae bacterium]MBT4841664.1 ribosome biogenesis GTPase Der [Anaerolineae bacterium]MBT6060153.1 ribosome biogenesis GTPase Der [Anaerolineae bacterium]
MQKPVVSLVGRPNVGKSSLFNRLVGERLAIVDDVPGTTRDRILSESDWNGIYFDVIDTGGIDPTHGGNTPLSTGSADFITDIRSQAQVAIEESDAVLFLTDGGTGPTSPDREVAQILRRSQKKLEDGSLWPPIYLIVNKCENKARREAAIDFYELGLGEPHPISAMHGTNLGDLLDLIVAAFPETEAEADDSVKFAIVGKPNAGKSSLLNKLVGKERAIVSPIAGTTRDAVDTQFEYEGIPLTLIDTAGIRKRGKIDPGVERYSVVRAKKAIERADVALLMIDAETGITAQDLHIAGFILDAWKSTIVVVNKWDSIEKDSYTMNYYTEKILYELNFMPYVPLLFISALTGQRVEKVLPLALKVQEARLTHISTSKLNKILRDALDAHPAPSKGGRQLKIYYATQVRSDPPTFLVYVNDHKLMHFSYRRFLENQIRAAYEFIGTPIRIVLKGKAKKEK